MALVGAFNVSTVAGGLLLLYKGTVGVDDVDVGAVAPIIVAGREKKMYVDENLTGHKYLL